MPTWDRGRYSSTRPGQILAPLGGEVELMESVQVPLLIHSGVVRARQSEAASGEAPRAIAIEKRRECTI
jgi:hypothetical protein